MCIRDRDAVETSQAAQYFKRNDSHYLLYEEDIEGFDGTCKSRIKFRDNMLELTRQGAVEMHMIFEENKRHVVPYNTPYGQLLLGIETRRVQVEEQEEMCIRDSHPTLYQSSSESISCCRYWNLKYRS